MSNWSTTDIDAPYHLCSVCELATVDDTEICETCAYVQSFLDNNDIVIHDTFMYSLFHQSTTLSCNPQLIECKGHHYVIN